MKIGGWESVGASKLVTCKRCGCGNLAWAKSKRTGKFYLCGTQAVNSDTVEAYWVVPNAPHSCAEYEAIKASYEAEAERMRLTADRARSAVETEFTPEQRDLYRAWQMAALDGQATGNHAAADAAWREFRASLIVGGAA